MLVLYSSFFVSFYSHPPSSLCGSLSTFRVSSFTPSLLSIALSASCVQVIWWTGFVSFLSVSIMMNWFSVIWSQQRSAKSGGFFFFFFCLSCCPLREDTVGIVEWHRGGVIFKMNLEFWGVGELYSMCFNCCVCGMPIVQCTLDTIPNLHSYIWHLQSKLVLYTLLQSWIEDHVMVHLTFHFLTFSRSLCHWQHLHVLHTCIQTWEAKHLPVSQRRALPGWGRRAEAGLSTTLTPLSPPHLEKAI